MDYSLKSNTLVYTRPVLRWSIISFLSLFFITLLMQFILWKQYSLEATYVQLKNVFVHQSLPNYLELGAICNSLEDLYCAQKYFEKVVSIQPNNKLGLANLAIVLAKQKRWKEAEPNFKAYFSLGGSSYDMLYWYGLTISSLKGPSEGMQWIIHSIKANPKYIPAGKEVVNYYLEQKQKSLALSLIGAMTRGHPENFNLWNNFLNKNEFIEIDKSSVGENWTLISLDGNSYYIPLVLREHTRLKFFTVFDDVEYNLINTFTLNELLIPIEKDSEMKTITLNERNLKAHKVSFPNVLVAGVPVGEVVFYACENCPNLIGKSLLKEYKVQYWSENQINFLNIYK